MNSNNKKGVEIVGNAGKAISIENMPNEYKNMINRLIPQSFGGDWTWNCFYFYTYFKFKNVVPVIGLNKEELEVVKDTMYFTIMTNNQNLILIEIK